MKEASIEVHWTELNHISVSCSIADLTTTGHCNGNQEVNQSCNFNFLLTQKYEMGYPAVSFGRFVMLILCCYFAFVIFKANNKLQSEQIGTIFRTVSKKTVQVRLYVHFYQDSLHGYGKIK